MPGGVRSRALFSRRQLAYIFGASGLCFGPTVRMMQLPHIGCNDGHLTDNHRCVQDSLCCRQRVVQHLLPDSGSSYECGRCNCNLKSLLPSENGEEIVPGRMVCLDIFVLEHIDWYFDDGISPFAVACRGGDTAAIPALSAGHRPGCLTNITPSTFELGV